MGSMGAAVVVFLILLLGKMGTLSELLLNPPGIVLIEVLVTMLVGLPLRYVVGGAGTVLEADEGIIIGCNSGGWEFEACDGGALRGVCNTGGPAVVVVDILYVVIGEPLELKRGGEEALID